MRLRRPGPSAGGGQRAPGGRECAVPDGIGGEQPEQVKAGCLFGAEELQFVAVAVGGVEDLKAVLRLDEAEGPLDLFADGVGIDADPGKSRQLGKQALGGQPSPGRAAW